jgi:hypothetical protein
MTFGIKRREARKRDILAALRQAGIPISCSLGTNPRALGVNPRALGINPKARRRKKSETLQTENPLFLPSPRLSAEMKKRLNEIDFENY